MGYFINKVHKLQEQRLLNSQLYVLKRCYTCILHFSLRTPQVIITARNDVNKQFLIES